MIPQIRKLGIRYTEWVNKPVDRKLRLFRNDFMEMLTITQWWMVPIVWIPFILFLIHLEVTKFRAGHLSYVGVYFYFMCFRLYLFVCLGNIMH